MNKTFLITAATILVLAATPLTASAGMGGPGGFAPGGGGGGGGGGIPPGPGGLAPGGGGGGGGAGGWGGGWGGGFGIHINPGAFHGYAEDRISCRSGNRIVRRSGFDRVRTIECRGDTYTYKGKRGGRHYRIKVDAYDGVIVSRHRL